MGSFRSFLLGAVSKGQLAVFAAAAAIGGVSAHADPGASKGPQGEPAVLIAQSEVLRFDIPAQPLSQSLRDVTRQAGLQFLADSTLTQGLSAPALVGEMSASEALSQLLSGTGLVHSIDGRNVTLDRSDTSKSGQLQLDTITVEAVLEGTTTRSYAAPDSFSATRTDTPLIETPQSAQSVSRQALEDTGAENLADAYEYLAGISRDNTQGGLQGDEYLARGFGTDNILFNGNRTSSASTLDTANVERVEALRGPTAALFGKGDPGGLINVVTKQPLSEHFHELTVSGGDGLGGEGGRFRQGRVELDLGGPVTEDRDLRYRFNAAYEDEKSFRSDVDEKVFFVSPVFDYRVNDESLVNLEFAYQHREDTFDRGVFFVNNQLILPRDFNLAEGNTGRIDKDYVSGTLRLEREFNANWTGRLGVYASSDVRDGEGVQQGGVNGNIAQRQRRDVESVNRFFTLQPELVGEVETGSLGHTFLIGLDAQHERSSFFGLVGPRGGAVDVFNPDFSIAIPAIDSTLSAIGSSLFDGTIQGESYGLYAQDQIDITDEWKLLVGGRVDRVDLTSNLITAFNIGALNVSTTKATFKDTHFSPRAGLVYQPLPFLSVYTSYAESYRPPTSSFAFADATGAPVDAETAQSYEAGIKVESLNGRLTGTFAVFRADKENVLESDPADPFGLSAINLGEVRSEGIELDITGEPVENLSIGVTYAYTDARTLTTTNALPAGVRLRNVPRHAASLQAAYRIGAGPLNGLRFFGSAIYEDDRFTDTSAVIVTKLPSYVRFNLGAEYEPTDFVTGYFLLENILDEEYYTTAAGRNNVDVGEPRRLEVGLRVKF